MIRRFALRASRTLAGAVVLAALALPSAAAPDIELSSQDRMGAPRDMGGGARGPGFAPQGGGQRPQFGAPAFRGHGSGASGYRGPAVGTRGYHRGHAFVRGRHYVRRGNLVLPLIGLGALGAIYFGSRPYTPYAYVDGVAGPQCSGTTEDGLCELRLTEVPLESGGAALQCVAYCPQ
jgi:hypothetical protein